MTREAQEIVERLVLEGMAHVGECEYKGTYCVSCTRMMRTLAPVTGLVGEILWLDAFWNAEAYPKLRAALTKLRDAAGHSK